MPSRTGSRARRSAPLPDLQRSARRAGGRRRGVPGRCRSAPTSPRRCTARLDLYRVLVPRIERLAAPELRRAPARRSGRDDPRSAVGRSPGDAGGDRALRGLCRMEPAAQHPAVVQPTVGGSGASSRFGRPRAAGARERTEHGGQRRSREDVRAARAHRHRPAHESGDARRVGTRPAGGDRRGARRGHVLSAARRERDGGRRASGAAVPGEPDPGRSPQRLPDREHPARASHRVARVVAARLRPPRRHRRRREGPGVGGDGRIQRQAPADRVRGHAGVLCAHRGARPGGRGARGARVGADARSGGGGAAGARRGNAARGPASARGSRARGIRARGRPGGRDRRPDGAGGEHGRAPDDTDPRDRRVAAAAPAGCRGIGGRRRRPGSGAATGPARPAGDAPREGGGGTRRARRLLSQGRRPCRHRPQHRADEHPGRSVRHASTRSSGTPGSASSGRCSRASSAATG